MERSPYSPSISDDNKSAKLTGSSKWTARVGVVLFLGPLVGVLGTVFGMMRAFDTLAKNDTATPQELSRSIGVSLTSTMIGIIVGIVGSILILVALTVYKNREPWFFGWCVTLSILWCIGLFPVGLLPAVPILWICFSNKLEFRSNKIAQQGGASQH